MRQADGSDPSNKMYVMELEGLGCPYEKLAQKKIVSDLLNQSLAVTKKAVERPPSARVIQPAYTGWEGISGNALFVPKGYISAVTFADKGEYWFNLAPFTIEEIGLFMQDLLDLSSAAFGATTARSRLSVVSDAHLEKILSHFRFRFKTQNARK